MPITEFKIYNDDPDVTPSYKLFRESDHKLLNSKKARQKIYRAFSKIPYNFNLHAILYDNYDKRFRSVEKIAKIPQKSDHITMVYTNNATGDYNSMTAWILAHRMMHGIYVGNIIDPVVFKEIIDIYNVLRNPEITSQAELKNNYTSRTNCETEILRVTNMLFTMKSARDNNINNPLDIGAEILAQFLVTGRVRLNTMSRWNPKAVHFCYNVWNGYSFSERNNRTFTTKKHKFRPMDEINHDEIDAMIVAAEKRMNAVCKQQMELLKGTVITF